MNEGSPGHIVIKARMENGDISYNDGAVLSADQNFLTLPSGPSASSTNPTKRIVNFDTGTLDTIIMRDTYDNTGISSVVLPDERIAALQCKYQIGSAPRP